MTGEPRTSDHAEVVTFGETMVLLRAPDVTPLRYADTLAVGVGGAESNVATGLVRLGVRAAWFGRVGDDELGRRVLQTLRGEGVDVGAATVDPGAPTGVMLRSTPRAGRTEVLYLRRGSAGSRLEPTHLDEAAIAAATILHVTGITAGLSGSARATVHAAIDVARAAGTRVCFDPNHREGVWPAAEAAPHLIDIARRSDIVLVGLGEAPLLTAAGTPSAGTPSAGTPEALLAAIAALGPDEVVLKLGPDGSVGSFGGDQVRCPAVPAPVVDPVGAGDGFAAGFLAAAVAGRPPLERLQLAAQVAARVITVSGDWQGLPTRAELDAADGLSR